jgi:hypothetical protein
MQSFSAFRQRLRLTERGQSIVEFAFMFPFLVLILVGTVDMGHGIYAYGWCQARRAKARAMAPPIMSLPISGAVAI